MRGLVKVKQFFHTHKNGISCLCGGKPRPKKGFSGTDNWKQGIGNTNTCKGLDWSVSFRYRRKDRRAEKRLMLLDRTCKLKPSAW